MKRSIHIAYLLIFLISFQLQAQGQTLPSACGGSKVRYGVSGLPNSIFQWDITGGTIVNNYNDSIDVTWNTTNGSGTLTVTEHTFYNCVAAPNVATITFDNPTLSLNYQSAICFGNTTSIVPVGSFQSYLWNNGSTNQSMTVSQPGLYKLTATDAKGCSVTDSALITLTPAPALSLTTPSGVCLGNTTNIAPIGTFASYLWSNGSTNPSITVSQPGLYKLTAADSKGCIASDSIQVTFSPSPIVNLGNDTTLCDQNLTLDAGSGGASYLWSTGESTSSILVSSSSEGQSIWVEVANDNGCISRDTIRIEACGIVPNTITPNGDNWNDKWKVDKYTSSNITVEIYDRWGRMVYQSKNGLPSDGWDGTSKGRPLPMDSYYYIVKFNNSGKTEKGTITIIR